MNYEWKLVPHPHGKDVTKCTDDLKKHSKFPTTAAPATQDDCANSNITIFPQVPMGRIDLIKACIQSCRMGDNCHVCHELIGAARFLSKEMLIFQNPSSNRQGNSDEITLIVKKCGRIIRFNQSKVEENVPYIIKDGTVLSILLPKYLESSSSVSSHSEARNSSGDHLVIQFTVTLDQTKCKETHDETEQEDSPELSLPIYSHISKHNLSNSFESSHLSPGILTLQESKSNLTQLDDNKHVLEQEENVLLSSLTVEQLNSLLSECDDSEKGRFRRTVLQMALGDGPLPLILRSTHVKLKNSNEIED